MSINKVDFLKSWIFSSQLELFESFLIALIGWIKAAPANRLIVPSVWFNDFKRNVCFSYLKVLFRVTTKLDRF